MLTASGATISGALTATSGAFTGTVSVSGSGKLTAAGTELRSDGVHLEDDNDLFFGDSDDATIRFRSVDSQLRLVSPTLIGLAIGGDTELLVSDGTVQISNFALLNADVSMPNLGADTGTTLVRNGSGEVKTLSSTLRVKENIRPWQPQF
jgi:hypothetical protein